MTDHNDLQAHLLAKVAQQADAVRATARELVDAVLDGHAIGLTRQQIANDLADGILTTTKTNPS